MNRIVLAAATDLVLTGLLLIISPELFGWLILNAEPSAAGRALGHIAGVAMFGFGLATWPTPPAAPTSGIRALLSFNLLATIYLSYLGVAGQLAGVLLWPAVALHAALTCFLGRAWSVGGVKRDELPTT